MGEQTAEKVEQKVVSRDGLRQRNRETDGLRCVLVEDAFGPGQAIWVRGFWVDEIAEWRNLCTTVDEDGERAQFDALKFQSLELAYCLLDGPLPDGKPLFCTGSGHPAVGDLKELQRVIPPAVFTKLERTANALSGFVNPESENVDQYPTAGSISSTGVSTGSAGSPAKSPVPSVSPGGST